MIMMWANKVNFFFIVAFCLLICCSKLATGKQTAEANSLYDKIFAEDAAILDPEETLETLIELDDIYMTADRDIKNAERSKVISTLLEASDIKPSKCDELYFHKLNMLYKEYKKYTKTVAPYLKRYQERQFRMCKSPMTFNRNARAAFNQLSDNEKINTRALMDEINLENNGLKLGIKHTTYVKSFINFIDKFGNWNSKTLLSTSKKTEFEQLFRDATEKLCFHVRGVFDPILYIHSNDDERIEGFLDMEMQRWINYAMVCREIIDTDEAERSTEEVYLNLSSRDAKKSAKSSISNQSADYLKL